MVLDRPAPDPASPLSSCESGLVIGEEGRVQLDGREYGIYAYAPGLDLDELVSEQRPDLEAVEHIRAGLLEALRAAPVTHGALRGAAVRIDRKGQVRLVGFTGRAADDQAAVDDLMAELDASRDGVSLLHLADREAPLPADHPLAGTVLSEDRTAEVVPHKVRTAAFATVTLILGVLAGWFMKPS